MQHTDTHTHTHAAFTSLCKYAVNEDIDIQVITRAIA